MLIPIGTDVRLRSRPVANWVLIGLNVAIFLIGGGSESQWAGKSHFTLNAAVPTLSQYITYQFLHGDLTHLLGNMLFLWVFGNAVCDRMGPVAYVLFYLAGGVFAGAVFAAVNENPLLGASGAIAAVTTAFMVLYPRVHVTLLLWLLFFVTTLQLPALLLIALKIILWDNVIAPRVGGGVESNVAFSAHLGGYAFGFLVSLALLAIRALPRNQFDLLALWARWRRRTGVVGEVTFSTPTQARPVRVQELQSRPIEPLHLSPADQLREDILVRLEEHDPDEAARLYARLLELAPDHVLPRQAQLDLANHLARVQQHDMAVAAYEAFLASYPAAADAAQVHLLVGLITARYLGDPRRAIDHLQLALDGLSRPDQRDLAQRELAALRAAYPNGQEST